ncbi:hypothetical protein TELCIR_17026 [Teladorsagia circumcincta]|uniref:Uncharacterized protein n=1 Tax=Teladorsagia circumcincta TaxID=45464 RepID=A0A2G9TTW1_TELCI|nr:hypothetical protein TELCIR_17026 [Teladorsagia circumcincta]
MASQKCDDDFSKKRRAEEHKLIDDIRRKRACVKKIRAFPSEESIQSKIRNFVKSIVFVKKDTNLEEPAEDVLDIPDEDELIKYGYYEGSIKSSPARSSDENLDKNGSAPVTTDDELEKYGYYNESTKSSPYASDDEESISKKIYPGSQKRIELEQRIKRISSYLKKMADVPERRLNRVDQMRVKDKYLVCSFCLEKGLHYSDSCPSYVTRSPQTLVQDELDDAGFLSREILQRMVNDILKQGIPIPVHPLFKLQKPKLSLAERSMVL